MERLHGRIIVPLPPPVPHIFTYETRVFFARQKRLVLLITATDDVCLIVIRAAFRYSGSSLIVMFTREIVLFLKPLLQHSRQYLQIICFAIIERIYCNSRVNDDNERIVYFFGG